MEQTVVEWLQKKLIESGISFLSEEIEYINQAIEMEKTNTDNKVIHFAEWLTKKHTTVLMTLYEQFEEQYYNKTYKTK
jgi:uncharacterized protein YwlG (UPF0340 family)